MVSSPQANLPPATLPRQVADLQETVSRLQQTVRLMKEHRQRVIDQRRRRMAIIGGSVSLLFHLLLLIYLGLIYRGGGSGREASAGTYQLAILTEEELTQLEETTFEELQTEAVSFEQADASTDALPASSPATEALSAGPGAVPALGGSGAGAGEGIGMGGGGGGGATSFFGIGSKGTRFAFIIDISGSMSEAAKLEIAKRELVGAVNGLPDYAYFYVLLFNNDFIQPPGQKGWMRARKNAVKQFVTWLKDVDPNGGTAPRTSFLQVFSLDVRPDVIYFLTDGQFQDITAEEIATLNKGGKRAVINTIQFGDRGGEELLRQIARSSGGVYRFVPAAEGF
jgi:hypothetical protein